MLISPKEINKILSVTGSDVTIRGKKYFEKSKVKVSEFKYVDDSTFTVKTFVQGSIVYEVDLKKKNNGLSFKCDCPVSSKRTTPCKHVIASVFDIYINPEKYMEFLENGNKFIDSTYKNEVNDKIQNGGIISYYENYDFDESLKKDGDIKLVPKVIADKYSDMEKKFDILLVEFKIGKDKLYNLKELAVFVKNIREKNIHKYGRDLEFKHTLESFSDESKPILEFIYKYYINYLNLNLIGSGDFSISKMYKSRMVLNDYLLDEFFEIYKNKKVEFDSEKIIDFVEENPNLLFKSKESDDKKYIEVERVTTDYLVYKGKECVYILTEDKLYKCSKDFSKKVYPLLDEINKAKDKKVLIPISSAPSFCEYLLPTISEFVSFDIYDEIITKYKPLELGTKVYLDIDNKLNVIADVKFCYGDEEFNPYKSNLKNVTCSRNLKKEAKVKEMFSSYKFLVDLKKESLYISNEDDIYNFLTDGINLFMKKFEVLVTDKLKNRQIISNKPFSLGIRITNDLLEIDINDDKVDEETLIKILKKYKQKKKYYRLKDGTYLNLENTGIDTLSTFIDNVGIKEEELSLGKISVPKYRAMYLDSILKNDKNITISKDESYSNIVNRFAAKDDSLYNVPEGMENILRSYQKTGFRWLKMLDSYNFGGILADDMGLGKTIQIISLLVSEKINNKKSMPSLVVCPSSLYINWEKEIKKFSKDMKILVVAGSAKSREELITSIEDYDVIITSYDLLKRDIEFYEEYNFRFVIADEAQYIKNNNTKNAKALKKIKAQTRFALTGTPIENSLCELWSIFDYIMPGYLFSYAKFRQNYEIPIIKEGDITATNRLKTLVAPFILRRMKSEVLKELPEKTETIMYSNMDENQKALYDAYLLQARKEIEDEITVNGFEKSKMKVLATITRLRQICLHPSLFIQDYSGESSKLMQCMQIIEDAILANHKILLFSGFTSMFYIIKKELEKRQIKYSMLTGDTKVDTRVSMVDEFNTNKEIKVFLISLKAGGTGLNLTGADMVIHFDPWWNLSSENQATDRAYRIGQRNNVQVFKLIVQDTIEEKIINLQNKKRELTNSVITDRETYLNNMSKDEILDLFKD